MKYGFQSYFYFLFTTGTDIERMDDEAGPINELGEMFSQNL